VTACWGFLYEYAAQTFCFSENAIRGNFYLGALELSTFSQIEATGSEKQRAAFFD